MPVDKSHSGCLRTRVLGLDLENPLIVASGPLSDSLEQILACFKAGAGAVVTKTIFSGRCESIQERVRRVPCGLLNSTTYSKRSPDKWLDILAALRARDLPVVASIHAESLEQLARLARQVVEAGASALELGISCPNDGAHQSNNDARVGAWTAAVRNAVEIPIAVKLTAAEGLLDQTQAALAAGADAISLSDALPALRTAVERCRPLLGGPVGYSGAAIKPLVLHAIYCLRQAQVHCEILGIGGIESAEDVLEYLQVGASGTQLYTALVTKRLGLLRQITEDLESWLGARGLAVTDLVGAVYIQEEEHGYQGREIR